MKQINYTLLLLPCLLLLSAIKLPSQAHAQNTSEQETLDQIVAVVNDHTILKSDVDQQVTDYMVRLQQQNNQQITFSEDVWYSVLQNIIDRYLIFDQAKKDSIEVSQEQVDREINRRIEQYVNQIGSEKALEERVGKSIVQLRTDLRKDYRREMIVGRLQQQKREQITITRPEVEQYFNNIPEDSLPTIPEQVAVSQIVKKPSAREDARQNAINFAKQLRDSLLNHGKSMEELARRNSDGPSASSGGALGMISVNQLVGEYSAAASALETGEISEVVETSFGFHIIRLNERSGDKIDTNHILIKVDSKNYDNQSAINRLNEIRDSVLTIEEVTFANMARNYSDDSNTAPSGGKMLNPQTGEHLINLSDLDPALYRIVILLDKEGDISETKPFNIGSGNNKQKAFRIVQLNKRIPEHVANLKQDYERIKQVALQEKQFKEMQKWTSSLRDKFYVEYKIPIPDKYKQL